MSAFAFVEGAFAGIVAGVLVTNWLHGKSRWMCGNRLIGNPRELCWLTFRWTEIPLVRLRNNRQRWNRSM